MKLVLNGELAELPDGSTVSAAVKATGAREPFDGIAVGVEGDVVPRSLWDTTALEPGQRVEVVRAVQGG